MSNLDGIKAYLDDNLTNELSALKDLGYEYGGCREESLQFWGRSARYVFISSLINRQIEIRFVYTSASEGGCLHSFIRRLPKEGGGSFYNELQMRVKVRKYYAYEFDKEHTLRDYIFSLNSAFGEEYFPFVNGKKFSPDKTSFRD